MLVLAEIQPKTKSLPSSRQNSEGATPRQQGLARRRTVVLPPVATHLQTISSQYNATTKRYRRKGTKTHSMAANFWSSATTRRPAPKRLHGSYWMPIPTQCQLVPSQYNVSRKSRKLTCQRTDSSETRRHADRASGDDGALRGRRKAMPCKVIWVSTSSHSRGLTKLTSRIATA